MLALRLAAGTALTFEPANTAGAWTIRASGKVGTIVAGSVKVLIRPKVTAANLFHMLEAGGRPIDVHTAVFEYEVTGDLLAAFSTFFARVLEQALSQGVPRVHTGHDDLLTAIRGRIDVNRQTRRGGLPIPVPCDFDEHTTNSRFNRIIVAAIHRLTRLPDVALTTRQALRHALIHFEEVEPLQSADLARSTTFSRLNQHFEPAERLARLVLGGSSIHDHVGTVAAGSFLIDMSALFETFIETRLRRYLREKLVVHGRQTIEVCCCRPSRGRAVRRDDR